MNGSKRISGISHNLFRMKHPSSFHHTAWMYCILLLLSAGMLSGCSQTDNNQQAVQPKTIHTAVAATPEPTTTPETETWHFYDDGDYKPIAYSKIAWTAFQERWSPDDYREFETFLPALRGEQPVHWQAEEDPDEDEEIFTGEKTISSAFREYLKEDLTEVKISYIYFWDLTGDGQKELVLETTYNYPRYLILHAEENQIYGLAWVRRWFQAPTKNGYFFQGKELGSICKLSFENGIYHTDIIAAIRSKNGTTGKKEYQIQDKTVSKKDFQKWEEKNRSDDLPVFFPAEKE